jgi:hypothetical protein
VSLHLKKRRTYLPTFVREYLIFEIFRFGFENIFWVFLGSSCRETAKNAIKKKSMGKDDRKKKNSQHFRPKGFDMDFPQKVFMVFLNSPC